MSNEAKTGTWSGRCQNLVERIFRIVIVHSAKVHLCAHLPTNTGIYCPAASVDTGRLSFDPLIFKARLKDSWQHKDHFRDMASFPVCFMSGKWFLHLSSPGTSWSLAPPFALWWSFTSLRQWFRDPGHRGDGIPAGSASTDPSYGWLLDHVASISFAGLWSRRF